MFHLLQTAVYAPGDEIYKKKKKPVCPESKQIQWEKYLFNPGMNL